MAFLSLTVWKLHQQFRPRALVICWSSIHAFQNIQPIKISIPIKTSTLIKISSPVQTSTHIKISTQLSSVGINPAQPNVMLIIWNGGKWGIRERVTDPGSPILRKGPRYLRRVSRHFSDALASAVFTPHPKKKVSDFQSKIFGGKCAENQTCKGLLKPCVHACVLVKCEEISAFNIAHKKCAIPCILRPERLKAAKDKLTSRIQRPVGPWRP